MQNEIVAHNDLKIRVQEGFFTPVESTKLLENFIVALPWESMKIKMFGRDVVIPRLQCWIGDEGCDYSYSGKKLHRQDWTKELLMIKEKISQQAGLEFNSVLVNYYRDGQDSMGWHADDEKELGINPTIASVSLGETRRFDIKHKQNPELHYKFELTSGSLLIMRGALQHHWVHQIPAQKKVKEPRINLTFRTIKKSL